MSLLVALHAVLGHAVDALYHEDRNDLHQSLLEYNNAWSTLSCTLEAHGAGIAAHEGCDRLPALVREICAALLETYSTRYEGIYGRLSATCNGGPGNDVGQSPGPITSNSSGVSEIPCSAAAASSHIISVANDPPPDAATAGELGGCGGTDSDGAGRRIRRRREGPRRSITPAHANAVGGAPAETSGLRAEGAPAGSAEAGPSGTVGGGACGDNGGGGGRRAGPPESMTEQMAEVYQMCHRPVEEGTCLDDLAGLGSVKEEVRLALLLPMKMPHLFRGIRQPARNFLLYGPPGTGKTMLVERIASEAGASLLVLTPGAILSKWSGESEKQLRAVFELASAMQPCIVFMDEVDSLAPTRGSGDDPVGRRLLNELLVQMSYLASGAVGGGSAAGRGGVGSCGGEGGDGGGARGVGGVYVFAATNRIQDCDPALLRRFDRRLAVPLPDQEARSAFLAGVLRRPELRGHCLDDADVAHLAERTEGYSGSDLAQLCREAAMQPVREMLRALAGGPWRSAGGLAAAAAAGSGGELSVPRPLAKRDFEWALTAVTPVAALAVG